VVAVAVLTVPYQIPTVLSVVPVVVVQDKIAVLVLLEQPTRGVLVVTVLTVHRLAVVVVVVLTRLERMGARGVTAVTESLRLLRVFL
jgi:hypothetical protein